MVMIAGIKASNQNIARRNSFFAVYVREDGKLSLTALC
jgi:hypothetical protein